MTENRSEITLQATPSAADTLERARRLANRAVLTVELQTRRLRSVEPEDRHFLFRKWADVQFLIVTLSRLRRAAKLAAHIPSVRQHITNALASFDADLPGLKLMRDVGEHIEDYGIDSTKRHNKAVSRSSLEVGTWNTDGSFSWLGHEINIDAALEASYQLFKAIKSASEGMREGGA